MHNVLSLVMGDPKMLEVRSWSFANSSHGTWHRVGAH